MKSIKWKIIIITCIVCVLPILLGVILWDKLPDTMAIHFKINNEPDGFASKEFTVFVLPLIMVALQITCCIINDFNAAKHGKRKKFETATKWIIPIMSVLLQIVTMAYSLGTNIDIRKTVALLIGLIFLVIGNYLPKFDYIKNYNLDTEKAKKINRFVGIQTVIMGFLSIASIFLPPFATIVWLLLFIPYSIACIAYGIKIGRSK